eukprot:CAMPEP_0181482736 /NCGR_PEP_ID=MMETSP1110-20121109/45021_1 /TAXON_ID=174948 /ORGANISM="Symbiodinium sp., Strain CCMP421" /LENGTH=91 /DNA_ID=CAMNT_0023608349 /DNA_START=87 /DNA_END=362 /DNA_ORIENTATION=+
MKLQAVAMVALQIVMPSAMLFEDPEAMQDETSFMQVGMSKPVARPRRTGRMAPSMDLEEDDEDTSILLQSSMKKTGVEARIEEFESDEFSM